MRKLFFFAAFVSFSAMSFAQTLVAQADGPDIKFDAEIIDYGKVTKGADGKRTFKFKNIGNAPLEIMNAQGSCGCTVPTKPTAPIMPGESAEIKVAYDTQRTGDFTKYVTVTTNVKGKESVRLTIKGNVVAEPDAVPTSQKSILNSGSGF